MIIYVSCEADKNNVMKYQVYLYIPNATYLFYVVN